MAALFPNPGPGSRLDRLAILISGVCIVHCLASAIILALLASAGGLLLHPAFHEVGLGLAIALGLVALSRGYRAHRRIGPALVAGAGLVTMGVALTLPHNGGYETVATLVGVGVLALGHQLNRRAAA